MTPLFDAAHSFSEGLSPVKQGDKWGFIDASGRWVISPRLRFDGVMSFTEGLAMVEKGEKYGFIDKTGKIVIAPRFQGL